MIFKEIFLEMLMSVFVGPIDAYVVAIQWFTLVIGP